MRKKLFFFAILYARWHNGNFRHGEHKKLSFAPDTIIIKTGTAVTWSNMDSTPHTVTSLTGLFDSGSMAAGQMYSYTFPTASTYVYHCTIHPAEKAGVVIVGN